MRLAAPRLPESLRRYFDEERGGGEHEADAEQDERAGEMLHFHALPDAGHVPIEN